MPPKSRTKHKLTLGTRNPCNQFLVQHLIAARNKGALGKFHERKDHRFFMYSTAIESVRKYPLPIVCNQQLKMLAGIGDYLSSELLGVIKYHYRKYLKHQEDNDEAEQKSNTLNKMNLSQERSIYSYSYGGEGLKCLSEGDGINYEDEKKDQVWQFSQNGLNQGEQSCVSEDSKTSKGLFYKPRVGTQAFNILKASKILSDSSSGASFTKKELQQQMERQGFDKIKQWKSIKNMFLKNEYLETDPNVDSQSFVLTAKSREYLDSLIVKQQSNLSKQKIQNQVKSFKAKHIEKQQDCESNTYSQSIQSSTRKGGFHHADDSESLIPRGLVKQKIVLNADESVRLVVDTREMKDHTEKGYFQEKMQEKYDIKTDTYALTIGDFVYTYNGKVLDFVIERKKADDLSSSIIDGRYKDQKYRLKNCGASNIIYLYEGNPSSSAAKTDKQLKNALNKTRIMDGFIVYKTKSINETAKLLSDFQAQLQKKIQHQPQSIMTIGTIDQFNRRNIKSRLLTVQKVFGLGLKSFPNVGKQTISNLTRYFKSYRILYDKLAQYQNDEDRIQFLNGLLKGGRTQAGVTKLIVHMLFREGPRA